MRCISETELRGITGVWTPVNLFICRGPPTHPLREGSVIEPEHTSPPPASMKHTSRIPALNSVKILCFKARGGSSGARSMRNASLMLNVCVVLPLNEPNTS